MQPVPHSYSKMPALHARLQPLHDSIILRSGWGKRMHSSKHVCLQSQLLTLKRISAGIVGSIFIALPLLHPGLTLCACLCRPLVAAFYRGGVFVMGQAADGNGHSALVAAARDSSLPPMGTAMGAQLGGEGLRETVSTLDIAIPGTCTQLWRRAHACL